jgi:imidazole glycerol-phosphate synthase subunit HisF
MILPRVIPVLLLQNKGLVKSIRFKDFNYIGDPINAVKIFNDKEVDEICLLDISASKLKREPDFKLIEEIGSEAFMPFAYGGGINNFEQAKKLFKLGAEKVILNNVILTNRNLVTEIAAHAGSQSTVVSIDIKKNIWGNYGVYSHVQGKNHSIDLHEYIETLIEAGAGEILLNSVDLDGSMKGLDIQLIRKISKVVNIPLIACGGVGSINDIKEGINAGASAVAAGSFFIYQGKHKAVLINYTDRSELKKLFYE